MRQTLEVLLNRLPAFDPDSGTLNAVIETPKGHRNKYKFDEERGLFLLDGVLPAGAVFPFDFGFVPSTTGGDGDPLDVLVLMDEPAFTGCLVRVRLLGVIEHFFVSYNEIKGKVFAPLGRFGPRRAAAVVEEGVRRFRSERGRKKA